MRKHHQKQLLELMKTLYLANDEIKRLLSKNEISAIIQLLSECQQSAIHIGEFIERLEGEGTKTVSYLEEYCDLLYRSGVDISNKSNKINKIGIYKQNQHQLVKIERSIKGELKPNKIEVVFLPYKASMWDSMESIWLAAKDDPQCDAYVIPIPYFDKLPSGALGQMNYEGNQYPGYVPIVDWQKYNIEERHPDVIVIHSPYDDANHVTSVHADFFCKRLKDLTDLLVYVPYFICVDDVEKPFCVCAGTLYANKVIVQSEKIKNTYINVINEYEKENNCTGLFGNTQDKFVVLGTPKLDKVINVRREDYQIPDEWRKRIERPDGSRKKVILYNTSISGLLEGNEKVLTKLQYVFDCFKSQENVVLLWRPHPLNNATYQVMRPQLLDEYNKMVDQYRQLGFGIYDDTSDLNRAIALSDAYYGDGSSLVALFQCTGKPVMIHNFSVNQENNSLIFENLYEDKDHFWFTAYNFNALFKMDKQTWETEYIGSIPNEKDIQRLYGPITSCKGNLYLTPNFAEEIAEYDPKYNALRQIPSLAEHKDIDVSKLVGSKFFNAVNYKNHLFFVGCSYPAILRIDLASGRSDFFTDWLEPLKKFTAYEDGFYLKSICVVGSCIMAAALNANAVVRFDMDTCTSQVYEVGSKGCGYSGICYDGRNYWLSPRHTGPIVKWDPNTTYTEYWNYPDGFSASELSILNIRYAGGYVWLFPNKANMALKIGIQDENIVVAEEFQQECTFDTPGSNYLFSAVSNDTLYAFTGKTNRFISLDCGTHTLREGYIKLSEKDTPPLMNDKIGVFDKDISAYNALLDFIYYEETSVTLNHYIYYIARINELKAADAYSNKLVDVCRNTILHADGTAGSAIYTVCKYEVMG